MKRWGIFLLVWLAAYCCVAADADMTKIKEQSVAFVARTANDATIRQSLQTQQPDGSWRDIDYTSKSRGSWAPRGHLTRVEEMARGYACKSSKYYQSKAALDGAVKGLNLWFDRDPQSPNWWHQSIGTPMLLCSIFLMLGDALPPAVLERGRVVLDRSKPGMTGQNKVWLAGIELQKGLLYDQSELVADGQKQIVSELCVAAPGAEGVQSDWSYHQHGPQLQFGNYGLGYFGDMTKWSYILAGTRYEFPAAQTAVLTNYFQNGLRWVLFAGQMDFSACGRQNTGEMPGRKYLSTVRTADLLLQSRDKDAKPLSADDFRFSGSRYFYDSDFLVQRSPQAYFSVKMNSKRTIGSETVNSENLIGRMTGHGAVMLLSDGNELADIGALWDWRKIPGTTAVQDDASLVCKDPGLINQSEWVGGVSDGEIGFCAMDFNNGEVAAQKSYFFFGLGMVGIGSRIRSDKEAPVYTVIAQHRAGKIGEAASETGDVVNGNWAYKVLAAPGAEIFCGVDDVTGNWRKVDQALSPDPVTGKMFYFYLNHGKKPRNGSYAYSVEFVRDGKLHDYRLLPTSSDAVQSVTDGKTVMVSFFEPGWVDLPDDRRLTADRPLLLMIRNGNLYAADPSQKLDAAELTVGEKRQHIIFPQGQLAGSTVSLPLP